MILCRPASYQRVQPFLSRYEKQDLDAADAEIKHPISITTAPFYVTKYRNMNR